MSDVYCIPSDTLPDVPAVSAGAKNLIERVCSDTGLTLRGEVPVKVHFGEEGNTTYITPDYFQGIVAYLQEKQVQPRYIETNVLYKSARTHRTTHIQLARAHGFDHMPIEIADGETGEAFDRISVNLKHFRHCMIGRGFSRYSQFVVLNHFKGHMLSGFGGALKQLGMGFASRGGKMDQHGSSKPNLNAKKCVKCGSCVDACPVQAIQMAPQPALDPAVCVGCALCTGVCPQGAVQINWLWDTNSTVFYERLAEYAYAAQLNKTNVYLSFALKIATGCDCEGHSMATVCDDVGLFAGTDPVALDQAVKDRIHAHHGVDFTGQHTLDYAEQIGLGTRTYTLVTL